MSTVSHSEGMNRINTLFPEEVNTESSSFSDQGSLLSVQHYKMPMIVSVHEYSLTVASRVASVTICSCWSFTSKFELRSNRVCMYAVCACSVALLELVLWD